MSDKIVLQILESRGLPKPKSKILIKISVKNKDNDELKIQTLKTKAILSDAWNEQFTIDVAGSNQLITLKLVDGEGEVLGSGKLNLKDLNDLDNEHDMWIDFRQLEGAGVHILVRFIEQGLVEEELAFVKTRFFKSLKVGMEMNLERDYIIILDKSGSMSGSKWGEAQRALEKLAPFVCKADPDGITFYVFSSDFKKYNNIKNSKNVSKIFKKVQPGGSTALHKVLKAALDEHFDGDKPTTILVITDGSPDSKEKVIEVIETASNRIDKDEDLSITFIQIGDDDGAATFLKQLDDELEGKFDIVDTVTVEEMQGMSFEEMIYKSIND
jgi:hypothetical protein